MEYNGVKYIKLTKSDHPKEGDVLYQFPNSEDKNVEPIVWIVTKWGAQNHGPEDNYLIEVVFYEFNQKPRKEFFPLNKLYRKLIGKTTLHL